MSPRRLAWALWGVCVALTATGLVFLALNGDTRHANSIGSTAFDAIFGIVFLTFPTVGAAIATREPRNAIGWLFLAAGLGAALEDSLLGYATYALIKEPGSLPGGATAGLVADTAWLPAISATLLLFVLFPTGRPMSPRWKLVVWLVGVDVLVYAVATLINPGPLYFYPSLANPLGVEAAGSAPQTAADIVSPVLFSALVVGLVALVLRFRRSRGVERLQIKWLLYAAAVWVACLPGLIVLGDGSEVRVAGVLVADLVFSFLISMIPVAVGAAILRHRLYDIDLVINRTLVYGSLTATLAGAYLGCVLLLQLALSPLTANSGLAIAASTLAVAALFRPARARIQAAVDRRFYRRRYDAAQTLEAFGNRLRDELDLDALGGDLRSVASETMQPAHVSLWLKGTR